MILTKQDKGDLGGTTAKKLLFVEPSMSQHPLPFDAIDVKENCI